MACVFIALISVPVLLFGTPIQYKLKENKKKKMMVSADVKFLESIHNAFLVNVGSV